MSDAPATIAQTRSAIAGRAASAEEITRAALARIDAANPALNAFLQVFHDRAMAAARDIDRRVASGETPGPLAGVPIALKDNLCVGPEDGGGRTTCGSRFLENYESPFSATVVRRLAAAGAIIVGKTNLDEFAMGSSGENSAFGPTRNPWDHARIPGGSSAGSAAAVAAGMVPAALGSDTGGSIRQPAGFCGIVGLKPTYGRVSRYGLVAFASSLDQVGPMARTVADAAAILGVIAGPDLHDSTCSPREPEDFTRALETPVESLRIGIPRQARTSANHPAVAAALENAAAVFRRLGAEVIDVDLPHADYGIAAYYIVAPAEASSNLARFDGIRFGRRAELGPGETLMDLYCRSRGEGFGAEVQRRIMLGTYVLSAGYYDAYYLTALRARRKIKDDFDAVLAGTEDTAEDTGGRAAGGGTQAARGTAGPGRCHALLMPSAPTPAFRLGEKAADPLAMYAADVYTVGANLAGLPGITLPGGFAREGGVELPVGVQLIGAAWDEARLLRIARTLERELALPHHTPP
ncbi:MAG: Asp-tRNA(Asn)/Glu-tRNA(Gln) amidotransferase subunit GatA, partial [Phycisphaerales bacterium]